MRTNIGGTVSSFAMRTLFHSLCTLGYLTLYPLIFFRLPFFPGSNFVVSQHRSAAPITRAQNMRKGDMRMGKMAKFGVFSPAVYASKIVLGEAQLNKIRGKAISLHSQYIGDFCTWAGAYHLRTRLIKKAKTNGDILGFLV